MPVHTINSMSGVMPDGFKSVNLFIPKTKFAHRILLFAPGLAAQAEAVVVTNGTGLSAALEPDGSYTVQSSAPAWTFGRGNRFCAQNEVAASGEDSLGGYQRISFEWTEGASPMSGEIRLYNNLGPSFFFRAAPERRGNAAVTVPGLSFTKNTHGSACLQLSAGVIRPAAICSQQLFHTVAVV